MKNHKITCNLAQMIKVNKSQHLQEQKSYKEQITILDS